MYHLYKTAATHTYLDNGDDKSNATDNSSTNNKSSPSSPSSQNQHHQHQQQDEKSPSDLKHKNKSTEQGITTTSTASTVSTPPTATTKPITTTTKKTPHNKTSTSTFTKATATSKSANALRSILETYKACDVVTFIETKLAPLEPLTSVEPRREGATIIELDSSMTPLQASTVLWEGNVLGAPVWDEREKRYVGFFDMRNMLQVLIESANIVQHCKDGDNNATVNTIQKQQEQEEGTNKILHVPDHKWGLKTHSSFAPSALSSRTSSPTKSNVASQRSGFHSVFANELNRRESTTPKKTTLSPSSKSTTNVLHAACSSAQSFAPPNNSSSASSKTSSSTSRTYRRNTSFNTTYVHQRHAAISLDPFPSSTLSSTSHDENNIYTVNTINAIASKQRFYSCNRQTKLDDLCRVLSMLGCHRMPIVDDRRVVSIVSQSALIAFLDDKLHPYTTTTTQKHVSTTTEDDIKVPFPLIRNSSREKRPQTPPPHERAPNPALHETLDTAGLLYYKNVISVQHTTTAYQTFQILFAKKLSGVAIVNSVTGKLVDCTSARDIKRAALDEGKTCMDLPILDYLKSVRENEKIMQAKRIKRMEMMKKKVLKRRQSLSDDDDDGDDEDEEASLKEDLYNHDNNKEEEEEADFDESMEMEDTEEEEEEEEDKTDDAQMTTIKPTTSYENNNNNTTSEEEEECTACHISENATVGQILSLLARTKSHRVFIVDDERKPVGVVSVTNIINFALGRPQSVEDHPHD